MRGASYSRGVLRRFAGFEFDFERGEFRRLDGEIIKLRPKTLAVLHLLVSNSGRILGKQELLTTVWPNIHVGEDSLFQCIREIRTALGDDSRQIVKSVSGRGYLFDVEVTVSEIGEGASAAPSEFVNGDIPADAVTPAEAAWRFGSIARRPVLAAVALCVALGIAVAAPMVARRYYQPKPLTIAIMPIEARTADAASATMAKNITDRLTDGLSKISNIHVMAPAGASGVTQASSPAATPDVVLHSELQRGPAKWDIQARLTESDTGRVQWSTSYAVSTEGIDDALQQSRLAAGIGYDVALHINALRDASLSSPDSKIVVDQAAAFINNTNKERFAAGQGMLEKALAARPDDVDLGAALAAFLLRGIQTAWYTGSDADVARHRAQALLEHALGKQPNYIPALQGYCRFLTATNRFSDSLVACEKALSFQPWDGLVLFQAGMTQLQLGRFEDALATFQRADALDTPQVSRWTWLLGTGISLLFLDRNEEALPWLKRSIAVTPGTGRTHFAAAAALVELGRVAEAKEYLAKGLQIRPGSTSENIALPTKNQSPRFLARSEQIKQVLVAAGLPEK